MAFYRILTVLFMNLLLQQSYGCDIVSSSVRNQCNITEYSANCSTKNISSHLFIQLPSCLQQIHIVSESRHSQSNFENVNFSRFSNLKELIISLKSPHGYILPLYLPSFKGLESLRILRIKHLLEKVAYIGFSGLKQLQVLDFTRSDRLNLTLFQNVINTLSETNVPLQKLILRNAQSFNTRGYPYIEQVDLSKFLCPLGKTLEFVDLSFNDIVSSHFSLENSGCLSNLKYLDIRYNLLATTGSIGVKDVPGNTGLLGVMLFLGNIETLHLGHQWYTEADRGVILWNSDDNTTLPELPTKQEVAVNDAGIYFIKTLFIQYKSWIMFILNECFKFSAYDLIHLPVCMTSMYDLDLCKLMKCILQLSDDLYSTCTQTEDKYRFFRKVVGDTCGITDCKYGFPIPLPPKLTKIDAAFVSVYSNKLHRSSSEGANFCIYHDNSLKEINMEGSALHFDFLEHIVIRGLKKLESFNWKNNKGSLHINSIFLHEFPNLREIQLAGNIITEGSVLKNNIFSFTPYLQVANISATGLSSVETFTCSNLSKLAVLDLSRNHLTTLDINVKNTALKILHLQHNQIAVLNEPLTTDLETLSSVEIDLTGNPLLCDCSSINFVEWAQRVAQKNITFINSHELRCKNLAAWNLLLKINVEELKSRCDQNRPVIIAVLSTLGVVAAISLIVLVYKRRWHLKHFIFNMKLFIMRNRNHAQAAYDNDVFVLYSGEEEDRLWVHRILVDQLEKTYGMKTHIHLRDFLVGEYIIDNVVNAISKSRKVIAVVSPNFVRSQWCIEEVCLTHSLNPGKLVLVLYKDIPATEVEVPQLIRTLMTAKTYCAWADNPKAEKYFFKKLVHVLYH